MDLALVCFPGGLVSRRDDRSSVSLENTSPIMLVNSTRAHVFKPARATKKNRK